MTHETAPIKVTPGRELARLQEAAAHAPLLLEKEGALYRVNRVAADDPFAGYDAEAVRASIRASAGMLTTTAAERLKADIYRAREEGTRPE